MGCVCVSPTGHAASTSNQEDSDLVVGSQGISAIATLPCLALHSPDLEYDMLESALFSFIDKQYLPYLSIFLPICLSSANTLPSLSACLSVSLSAYLPTYLPTNLYLSIFSICALTYPLSYLSTYLSLPFSLSPSLSIYTSTYHPLPTKLPI